MVTQLSDIPIVVTATPARDTATVSESVQRAIATLTLAFSNDPVNRWLYPTPHQFLTYFPQFVQAFGGQAFNHNMVYHTADYGGVALWIPPGVEPDPRPVMDLMAQSVAAPTLVEVFAIFEQMEQFHPQYPHWYLPFIGVEPGQQGQGYGSALLRPVLERCDRTRLPAYLESSNPDNIPFYLRHGFDVLGVVQAGDSPPIIPMLRQPQ
jgi:GNAT superfamily N-acetyltransferase